MARVWTTTALVVVCALVCDPTLASVDADTDSPHHRVQYEWVRGEEVYAFSQPTNLALLPFTVPPNTESAHFHAFIADIDHAGLNRTVLLSLRRSGIPVVNAFNESVPEFFSLTSDQLTGHVHVNSHSSFSLPSPTPGRVFLAATVLNPLDDVIENLRWGQPMPGSCSMVVKATYTLRTDVTSLPVDDVSTITLDVGQVRTFRFPVPAFTMGYAVVVSGCGGTGAACPVVVTVSESLAVHGDPSAVSVDCVHRSPPCLLPVDRPLTQHDHFVTFAVHRGARNTTNNVTFDVSFDLHDCPDVDTSHAADDWMVSVSRDAYLAALGDGVNGSVCVGLGHLGRVGPNADSTFTAYFSGETVDGEIIPDIDTMVPDFTTDVRSFSLQDMEDSGGILNVSATLRDTDWTGVVWLCAMAQRVPQNGSVGRCEDGVVVTLNNTEGAQDGDRAKSRFQPFPASGTWYLAAQSQCWGQRGPEPCSMLPMITFSVGLAVCAPNQCGKFGSCQLYMESTAIFAGCQCFAGYRGMACTDSTYGVSEGEQLVGVYLLVLSNLAFLPAVLVATVRRFFTPALVFLFTCVFSTFYHACDANHVYQLCILDYDTLAFCDFLGSILSFYALLLTMARIPEGLRTFLLVGGTLLIAAFTTKNRHCDAVHILPQALAATLLFASWGREMYRRRRLFPSKRRYLLFLLPGVALAAAGIGVNYGLMWHHSTYQYTHSFWHLAVMTCPCLLLPPRQRNSAANKTGLSISAHDVIRTEGSGRQHLQEAPGNGDAAMLNAATDNADTDHTLLI